jgi:hypothetical protein
MTDLNPRVTRTYKRVTCHEPNYPLVYGWSGKVISANVNLATVQWDNGTVSHITPYVLTVIGETE